MTELNYYQLLDHVNKHSSRDFVVVEVSDAIRTAAHWLKQKTITNLRFCFPVFFIRNTRSGSVKVAHFYARVVDENDPTKVSDTDYYIRIELELDQKHNTYCEVNILQKLAGNPLENPAFQIMNLCTAKPETDCSSITL